VTANDRPRARQWVTPEGARIDLKHLTDTVGYRTSQRIDGGSLDGWSVTVAHPNGRLISDTHLGATVPEADLAAAIDAVGAYEVTGLARPRGGAR
jgi:hypothetical protein